MNSFIDDILVGAVLLTSAGYAVMALGPRSVRRQILAVTGGLLARAPKQLGLGRVAERLEAASVLKAKGACGGCDSCGTEQTAAHPIATSQTAASQTLPPQSGVSEIRIPVGKVGRRVWSAAASKRVPRSTDRSVP
jgi:hypothetical protein